MSPEKRQNLIVGVVLVALLGGLVAVFPRAYAFVELAARELRYFWWLILILALAAWLVLGLGKRNKDE